MHHVPFSYSVVIDTWIFFYRTLPPFQGMCESYRGDACAKFLGNQSIWVLFKGRHQQNIEKKLSVALTVIRAANQMSERYATLMGNRQTDRQAGKEADRQTDRQTDTLKDKQTDRDRR